MKKGNCGIFSLFLVCALMKFGASIASDVGSAKAQSPFIVAGGSYSSIGDMPASCDSVIHLGSPFMDNLRVVVLEDNITRRSLAGNWIPLYFLYRSDTATTLATKTNLKDSSAALRSLIGSSGSSFVKYTDTATMLAPYARTGVVNAGLAGKLNIPDTTGKWKWIGYTPSSAEISAALGFTPISTSGARSAISLTTTGSGAATYNSSTGVLNVPTPSLTGGTVTSVGITSTDFSISGSPVTTSGNITANLNNSGVVAGTYNFLTVNTKGIVTAGANRTINNAPGRSIVTTAAAANGWQISATKEAEVSYSATIGTSISLSGNSSGYIVLEIASTNSSTASDWTEISRITSGQSGGVVVGITLNQVGGGPMVGVVPPGYYVRQRSVNVAGTPSFTTAGQQEVY